MVAAVVFAFAVADGLAPVVGAAPFEVLARQLPRLLVVRLNRGGDRGVRFFPFLGTVAGSRTFLELRERFEPEQLADLHKQGDVGLLCDGVLHQDVLRWRAIDGASLRVLRELELPFDSTSPTEVMTRLEFEVMDLLGIPGRPHDDLGLDGPAVGWLLILKDALLRREAGLGDDGNDPFRSARRCIELAPGAAAVADVVMDLAAHLLSSSEARSDVADVLARLADGPELASARCERLSALLLSAGDEDAAATMSLRAATAAVERQDLVERTVGLLFRLSRVGEAAELVELARRRGVASVTALAQYAACCDQLGDRQKRHELCDEMLQLHDLPLPVSRLLVSFLIEEERAGPARTVALRALAKDPAQPVMHFELGRACLSLDDCDRAAVSLQEAIHRGLPAELEPRARRLLRLAAEPGLWRRSQDVEAAVARRDFAAALRHVTVLARNVPRVAEVWFLAGVVRHKLGDDTRAERALRRALRMDQALPDAHNRLGILLVARGAVE
ncbi:MAG: hypothetical protein KDC98_17410, partial [Planctomycetes bacterium]|nr:hypothetical protein [Planctomycetota bacterium]